MNEVPWGQSVAKRSCGLIHQQVIDINTLISHCSGRWSKVQYTLLMGEGEGDQVI